MWVILCLPFLYSYPQSTQDQWMVVMSTQLIGFSVGGISRRFLVDPPSMSTLHPLHCSPWPNLNDEVWPANLVTCALFNTLHSQTYAGVGDRGGLSREKFFLYCFVASAVWCMFSARHPLLYLCFQLTSLDIVPGYLFQALRWVFYTSIWRMFFKRICSVFSWVNM